MASTRSRAGDHEIGGRRHSSGDPDLQPDVAYGGGIFIHGGGVPAVSAANFFDQEGAAYFGELEEALMIQGVNVNNIRSEAAERRTGFLGTKPPTLDIFPSWPTSFLQASDRKSKSGESIDSGSAAQDTISPMESLSPAVSRKASPDDQLEQQQKEGMGSTDASRTATPPPILQHSAQPAADKRKVCDNKDGKLLDAKTLRRLAQNREAARKSRLRKKAYVQQLESSRMKLTQIEQDLHRARSQGLQLVGGGGAGGSSSSPSSSEAGAIFDVEYGRWVEEGYKHMSDLRGALQVHLGDVELRTIVDEYLAHYDEFFRLKVIAARADVFHLIAGTWTSPAERCFLWMGGFRPSELLKILMPQLDPLTEQQAVAMCGLQQSSQQAEEALSQGLEQLHHSLADTVASGSLIGDDGGIANPGSYMAHMAIALAKLSNLEGFVRQADNLRQQTLHQMRQILTVRQAARCFLAIGEYYSRLRALSSLWASRPPEGLVLEETSSCPPTSRDLQMIHQLMPSQFSAF